VYGFALQSVKPVRRPFIYAASVLTQARHSAMRVGGLKS
jgi:hypothetical protein